VAFRGNAGRQCVNSVNSVSHGNKGKGGAAEHRAGYAVETSSAPFAAAFTDLERRCPDYVESKRWQQAVEDGRRFLVQWGEQAAALGWTEGDLIGLHEPPAEPHPSYSRLSRLDHTGLIWLLQGRPIVALTAATATIKSPRILLAYRKAPAAEAAS
jgi:hypothetical protein